MIHVCYIGLGSNLGDSQTILKDAVTALKSLGDVRVSQLYASAPMGPQDQPDYLNAAVELKTSLEPLALLDQLQAFEQQAGRVRLRHWGERTLDLDLLLFDDQQIQHPRLIVPHVGICERDFVMIPLLDLDPTLQVNGQALHSLELVRKSSLKPIPDASWAS